MLVSATGKSLSAGAIFNSSLSMRLHAVMCRPTRARQMPTAILQRMKQRTLQRTVLHGHCGEFRVETVEFQAPGDPQWSSTAYVYHRDLSSAVATIEEAGKAGYRGDARAQAMQLGRCLAEFLDPAGYRVA